jgi:hypothetical protein
METTKNGFKNSGLWPVDRYVFTDDDFAPSTVTDQPETIELQKITPAGIERFGLGSAYATMPATPKYTPGYNGCIPVGKKMVHYLQTLMVVRGQSKE